MPGKAIGFLLPGEPGAGDSGAVRHLPRVPFGQKTRSVFLAAHFSSYTYIYTVNLLRTRALPNTSGDCNNPRVSETNLCFVGLMHSPQSYVNSRISSILRGLIGRVVQTQNLAEYSSTSPMSCDLPWPKCAQPSKNLGMTKVFKIARETASARALNRTEPRSVSLMT